jgi:hypothetical protein
MQGVAEVIGVVVWPALIGFAIWLFKTPLGRLLEVVTARLAGRGKADA